MTWALGIALENGKFVAEVLAEDGGIVLTELNELSTSGTLAIKRSARKGRIVTDFSDWKQVSSSEYLEELGIALPETARCRHSVFEFTVKQTRYLIPALALMRALFRPAKYLLPTMFLPQALDRVSFIDFSTEVPRITVDASWAQPGSRCMNEQVQDGLQWMCSAPSARMMAGSVHAAALGGRLDLTLPRGEARICVHGTKIGKTYFASDITFVHIKTNECFEDASKCRTVYFQNQNACSDLDHRIPCGAHGQIELTDDEWEKTGPILLSNMAKNRIKLNQRDIFDGILTKLSTQKPWKKIAYKSGTNVHAQQAYRSWTRAGTFDRALAALSAMRNSQL